MLFKKAKTKDYKILFAYLTETKDVNLYKIDTDIHELKIVIFQSWILHQLEAKLNLIMIYLP